jgi:hypothetical protein
MNLPIDTTKVRFTLLSEPRLQNEYGKTTIQMSPKGEPIYRVQVLAFCEGEDGVVLLVKVPGEQRGLRPESRVKVRKLQLLPWTIDNRSGISYHADAIEPEVVAK